MFPLPASEFHWYVLITRAMPYKTAAEILQRLEYTFYLPLQKQLRYWSDRKKWIEVPVLAPYLFVYTNLQDRVRLFNASQNFRFLTHGGQLAVARKEEVENIRLLCNHATGFCVSRQLVKCGDEVIIKSGPFEGMKGYTIRENGKNRFIVQIHSLGQFASVEIENSLIQAC